MMLQEIIAHKQLEVNKLKVNPPLTGKKTAKISFKSALQSNRLSVIAEIKRKTPSKGDLSAIKNPIKLAADYIQGGASVISVLTDEKYFGGTLTDLINIKNEYPGMPILRKDFIIDEIQLVESSMAGADAVLLIVSATKEKTERLLNTAKESDLEVVVEVHTKSELDYALDICAEIIMINNRDLNDFSTDINTSHDLIKTLPSHITTISASGISTALQAQSLYQSGFNAVLVGESLIRSENPVQLIKAMRGVL